MKVITSLTLILTVIGTAEAYQNEALGSGSADTGTSSRADIHPVTGRWLGPEGVPLPFSEDDEIVEFLRTAPVVATKVLSSGSNRPLKVALEKDGVRANAIFRNVHETENYLQINRKTYRDFRDSYANEGAAYELSRLLGIDNVPPCVSRTINGKKGSLQLWVENAKSMTDRVKEGIVTLANDRWTLQRQMMRVFDALIYNFDRNTGNMLLDSRGKLWFIDHTRSFLVTGRVEDIDSILLCERSTWEKLQSLDDELLKERLHTYLDSSQRATLLERRDKIVAHFRKLIEEKGEQAVLFDASELAASE
jgi:hypothetical protein